MTEQRKQVMNVGGSPGELGIHHHVLVDAVGISAFPA